MEKLLETIDKVLDSVDIWKMECNISAKAAKMAYEAMSYKEYGEENKII